jgi:lipoyl(octanoyl) transferase
MDRALHSNLSPRRCQLYCPGLVPYEVAWQWQRSLLAVRRESRPEPNDREDSLNDILILLEHPPVYTLGQGSSLEFLKFDPAQNMHLLCRTERGGEVTYHCPGQVVGYPILNLRYYQQDLHWYLRQLEEVLIRVIASYGLKGDRIPGLTGVWMEGRKVAAIGIKVSRWITMHGFALNVCPDLSGFQQIVPCGIEDKPVGSLAEFVPGIQTGEVQGRVAEAFAAVFNVELNEVDLQTELQLDRSPAAPLPPHPDSPKSP